MDEEKRLEEFIKAVFFFFILGIIGFQIIQLVTLGHEGFHSIVLSLFGCKINKIGADIYTGATSFDCNLSNSQMILSALAGPIGSFCFALFIWYKFGKDSWIRYPAIFGMLYSSIPSLYPKLIGSDMWFAVQKGFPEIIGYVLWVLASGIATYAILCEIEEKDILKRLVR